MVEIKLYPIEKQHLPKIQEFRNSDLVMPYCRQYRPLSMEDMEKWFKKLTEDKDYNLTNDMFVFSHYYEICGVCGLTRIDWRNRKAEVSFYVGEPGCNNEEYIGVALSVLMEYAFKTLNLHKVYWPVYSFNPNLPIYEKFLSREYVAKGEYYWEGKYHDRIILVKYEEHI